jgi:addiction module HigA family antidote
MVDRERLPAIVVAPGRIIQREIEARGWSQKDLAVILNRPFQAVNEIINGVKQITPETAIELGVAFGTSSELWMNLETKYRLWLAAVTAV